MKATILNKEVNGDFVKGSAVIAGQKFDFEIIYLGGEVHNLTVSQNGIKKSTVVGLPNFEKVKTRFKEFGLI